MVFLFGGPGSGKKTQAEKICAQYTDVKVIKVRELLEAEVSNKKSAHGKSIEQAMKSGEPVDSEVVVQLIRCRIQSEKEVNALPYYACSSPLSS